MIQRDFNQPDINQVFFPVAEEPVYLSDGLNITTRIPGFKAIVDRETNYIFSVVTSKYNLILNRRAFELADYVIRGVFPGKCLDDFEVFNIIMPKTKGSCRIDLIIPQNFKEPFGDSSDPWTPFLRITNSYNRMFTLKYEIGFCRWICKNGCIFGQKGYTFSVEHTYRVTEAIIKKWITEARKSIGDIADLWTKFQQKLVKLRSIPVDDTILYSVYCKAYGLKIVEDEVTDIQKESYRAKAIQINKACKEYFTELDKNAYALFNVLTDYATYPEGVNGASNYIHGYQRKVGEWVDSFLAEYEKKDFSWNKYLADYVQSGFYLQLLVLENK